jgi:hypothetical protein
MKPIDHMKAASLSSLILLSPCVLAPRTHVVSRMCPHSPMLDQFWFTARGLCRGYALVERENFKNDVRAWQAWHWTDWELIVARERRADVGLGRRDMQYPGRYEEKKSYYTNEKIGPYSTILQTRHVMFFLTRINKSSEGSENENGSTTRTSINIVASS